MSASASLKALRELNRARRAADGTAIFVQAAVDAADQVCGFKRREPERVLQHGESVYHHQSGRQGRRWPHRVDCACLVCTTQRRYRARRAERAFAVFDPRPLLRRCSEVRP